jgi:hypothetical protein
MTDRALYQVLHFKPNKKWFLKNILDLFYTKIGFEVQPSPGLFSFFEAPRP